MFRPSWLEASLAFYLWCVQRLVVLPPCVSLQSWHSWLLTCGNHKHAVMLLTGTAAVCLVVVPVAQQADVTLVVPCKLSWACA